MNPPPTRLPPPGPPAASPTQARLLTRCWRRKRSWVQILNWEEKVAWKRREASAEVEKTGKRTRRFVYMFHYRLTSFLHQLSQHLPKKESKMQTMVAGLSSKEVYLHCTLLTNQGGPAEENSPKSDASLSSCELPQHQLFSSVDLVVLT